MSRCRKLVYLSSSVFMCYLFQAYLQERIFQFKDIREFPNYFSLLQSVYYCMFALVHAFILSNKKQLNFDHLFPIAAGKPLIIDRSKFKLRNSFDI
ncbi:hypothetical protein GJ496_003854 [Pomphorhynchus laevis]|nr:hypothetical protein GJ496_003854 [Pomphorhynchus laevis]